MRIRLDRKHRTPAIILGVVTLADVVVLLLWDAFPGIFPAGSHAVLGAVSLALIAVAYLVYQLERRPAAAELVKAIMLAAAFLFWAANQFWPNSPRATLFNDVAIALFVLDVFLVIVGWPAALPDSSFGETGGK
jgi:predicted exporter